MRLKDINVVIFLGGFPSFFSDFWPEFKKLVFIQQSKNDKREISWRKRDGIRMCPAKNRKFCFYLIERMFL